MTPLRRWRGVIEVVLLASAGGSGDGDAEAAVRRAEEMTALFCASARRWEGRTANGQSPTMTARRG